MPGADEPTDLTDLTDPTGLEDPTDPEDPTDLDADGRHARRGQPHQEPHGLSHGLRGSRWPGATPAWVAGPVGALVAAALAAVLTAVVGVHHVQALAEQRLAADRAVLSLQAGSPSSTDYAAGPLGTDGWSSFQVVVPLFNRGSRGMRVSVRGLSTPHQHVHGRLAPVDVGPGAATAVVLPLAVDCAGVPGPQDAGTVRASSRARVPTTLRLDVHLPGGRPRPVSLPVPEQVWASFDDQLAWACRPDGGASGPGTAWQRLADGRLQVSVAAGRHPVRLGLQQSPGLQAATDPPLPLTVPAGSSVAVAMSVAPVCPVVGDGSSSWLGVVALDSDGTVVSTLSGSADGGTGTWLARRVALACG